MYQGTIKLSKIKTNSKRFTTPPSEKKMAKRRAEYAIDHEIHLVVRAKSFELIEGYTYYTLAKELGLDTVECTFVNEEEKYWENNRTAADFALKKSIYKNANNRCYICGKKVKHNVDSKTNLDAATIDHVLPKAKGGKSNVKNLKCCCLLCNRLKADNLLTNDLLAQIKIEREFADNNNINTIKQYKKARREYA